METSENFWLIRSPYQHKTWDDVLMRNLFRLQGIRNPKASKNIGQMRVGDRALTTIVAPINQRSARGS